MAPLAFLYYTYLVQPKSNIFELFNSFVLIESASSGETIVFVRGNTPENTKTKRDKQGKKKQHENHLLTKQMENAIRIRLHMVTGQLVK